MRSFHRCAALAVTSIGLLSFLGCGEDNEKLLKEQAAKGGEAVSNASQPQNLDEYAARQKQTDTGTKGGAYAKKGK